MDSKEVDFQLSLSYKNLVLHLIKKYGKAEHDYFTDDFCSSVNKRVSRSSEGLFCHHIDEDKAILLSSSTHARKNPFEYQKAERLVYCNLLEHLILHVKIVVEPKHEKANLNENVGIGGITHYLCRIINDLFIGYKTKKQYLLTAFELIKDNYDDYVKVLRYFFYTLSELKKIRYSYLKKYMSEGFGGRFFSKLYDDLMKPDPNHLISSAELLRLKKTAELGDFHAQIDLYYLYNIGTRIEYNFDDALFWLRRAAQHENADIQYLLAKILINNNPTNENTEEAIEMMVKSAKSGHTYAIAFFDTQIEDLIDSITTIDKIIFWYKKLYDLSSNNIKDSLFEKTLEIVKSDLEIENIISFFKEYANQSDYKSKEFLLKLCLWLKKDKKEKELLKWVLLQAENADRDYQHLLGFYYSKVRQTKNNIERSTYWYNRAKNNLDQ